MHNIVAAFKLVNLILIVICISSPNLKLAYPSILIEINVRGKDLK